MFYDTCVAKQQRVKKKKRFIDIHCLYLNMFIDKLTEFHIFDKSPSAWFFSRVILNVFRV